MCVCVYVRAVSWRKENNNKNEEVENDFQLFSHLCFSLDEMILITVGSTQVVHYAVLKIGNAAQV